MKIKKMTHNFILSNLSDKLTILCWCSIIENIVNVAVYCFSLEASHYDMLQYGWTLHSAKTMV